MRRAAACVALTLAVTAVGGQELAVEWETRGFQAFRAGTFDSSGFNLYVSKSGTLQTIHRTDVNEDGYPDLIFNNTHDIAYVVPAYEYVFNGRAAPQRREYPGAGSVRVRAVDLNADGNPELVIARGFDDTTRVMNSWIYWGDAGGWSVNRHQELLTPYAQDVCSADFNGDGRVDLAFAASGTTGVNETLIYWGRRNGFRPQEHSALETPGATSCLAADLDRDGIADLVITGTSGLTIYWGGKQGLERGRSTFISAPGALGAASFARRLVIGTSHGPFLYRVEGRGFRPEQQLTLEGSARVAAADLNRDGVMDLVVTRTAFQHNWDVPSRIYWGRRRSVGLLYSDADFTELPTHGATDVAIADLDQDGYPDLVFANSRSYVSFDVPSYVYWGGPEGYSRSLRTDLPTHGAVAVSTNGTSVYFANANRGSPIGKLNAYVYLGNKEGRYSTDHMLRLPTVGGYESCVADLDDDGYNDIVLLGSHEGDPEGPATSTIYWGGPHGYSPARFARIPTRGAIGCAVGETNNDGFLDLLFTNMDDGTVALFPGGPGRFPNPREQTLRVPMPRFPAIADLNRDGYPELLVPSVEDGLWIFWGTQAGYHQENHTVLPGVGTVSEQIADLNHDGYLDLIVCNLFDRLHGRYHGINTYIYWGSRQGYSTTNRTELPSLGAHHATVADFNRDGALDIFISNYQSEFTRNLDSFIYWGSGTGEYTVQHRTALHVGSAAGVVAEDLNGDGWIDLAVSNHVTEGDHHTLSPIFWNGPDGFLARPPTWLPTIGPHMMSGVDEGNLYTRKPEESYESTKYDCGGPCVPEQLSWDGVAPFQSFLGIQMRGADSSRQLEAQEWHAVCGRCAPQDRIPAGKPHRWWQYRAMLHSVSGASPRLRSVKIVFRKAG